MTPEEEDQEWRKRREDRKARMLRDMEICLADTKALESRIAEHPLPWTWCIAFHDGWFYQFKDANGRPCLGDDLRDPEDAAYLLTLINKLNSEKR